jgi:hypothetical protein
MTDSATRTDQGLVCAAAVAASATVITNEALLEMTHWAIT